MSIGLISVSIVHGPSSTASLNELGFFTLSITPTKCLKSRYKVLNGEIFREEDLIDCILNISESVVERDIKFDGYKIGK